MKKELTCIGCPMGCQITAEVKDGKVTNISGNKCKIGENYAKEELIAPKRMITALMQVKNSSKPLPVKTSKAIDKNLIFECLKEIKNKKINLPIKTGEVIIKNTCNTDVDIVATKDMD